jgi:hypothetical protein
MTPDDEQLPITEEWLSAAGFKWHQLERQPHKHWLLWIGRAMDNTGMFSDAEDLGVEVTPASWPNRGGEEVGFVSSWFCWLRSDAAGRYHRFIHIRHIKTRHDLLWLIEALTGREWSAENALYGMLHTPARAAKLREEYAPRLDVQMRERAPKWSEPEKDPTQGGALPEHLEAHEKARKGGAP